MNQHIIYMRIALALAKRAEGKTSPNPLVGALVVRNGRIVGKGYHKKAGTPHAERIALKQAIGKTKEATLYVTLEPCDHYGKTPPCTDAIIQSGIKKVVVGMRDPNPVNNGSGIRRLRNHGIQVEVGVLKEEALAINRPFIKMVTKKMPYVTVKVAQSLDGKIATVSGDSRWITNSRSRAKVHMLRSKVDAILVGVNTVIKDNPLLTVRLPGKSAHARPVRVILDTHLKTPLRSKVVLSASKAPIIIATTKDAASKKALPYLKKGVEIITVPEKRSRVDVKFLLKILAKRHIAHVLTEGGGEVIASLLNEGLVDRMQIFIAPKIIGGSKAPTSVEGGGVRKMSAALNMKTVDVRRIGEDIIIEGELGKCSRAS